MADCPKRRTADNGWMGRLQFTGGDVIKIIALVLSAAGMYYALDKRVSLTEWSIQAIHTEQKTQRRILVTIAKAVGTITMPTDAGGEP